MLGPYKILLTGFGPFPKMPINPCVEIVKNIDQWAGKQEFELHTSILDVTYQDSFVIVQSLVEEFHPDLIIHLGVSSRIEVVQLEHSAINCRNATIPDVVGQLCTNETIDSTRSITGRTSTTLNLELIQSELSKRGHEVNVSHDAGQYVCNSLYWQSLNHFSCPVLFVHIPNTTFEGHHTTVGCIQGLLMILRRYLIDQHTKPQTQTHPFSRMRMAIGFKAYR